MRTILLLIFIGLIGFTNKPSSAPIYSYLGREMIAGGYQEVWSRQLEDGTYEFTWQVTYTTPGASNWTCPAGVRGIQVECWGAGGGGGCNVSTNVGSSGGGGGGAYVRSNYSPTNPGSAYAYVVGDGGYGGSNANGGSGTESYFIDATTIMAAGGLKGWAYVSSAAGGSGGSAASSYGTIKYSGANGGAGASGSSAQGGPGGSSGGMYASATNEPTPWTTATSKTAPTGGARGGNGGAVNTNGSNAAAPGAGGGGAGYNSSGTKSGGTGADGQVRITYLTYGATIDF